MGFFNSSIGRKVAMALSALFLMFFLLQHLVINITSLIPDNGDTFNKLSHFMGTNPLVQFALQPVLIGGVVFHFVMGFILEIQNKRARGTSVYVKNNGAANSTWFSRNMIISGAVILAFVCLHFIDFWLPEINTKFIKGDWSGAIPAEGIAEGKRYFIELQHKFVSPLRVTAYVIAFVFLALHLNHGFTSAFQSVGVDAKSPKASNKYAPALKIFGVFYSFAIPLGFVVVAIFHFVQSLTSTH